ncbi:MAG: type IX secretion system sortase PorU [Bacteroidota bacterium]|nr:type IX secretion system sortase PorU [Bacteroidota bacterium]
MRQILYLYLLAIGLFSYAQTETIIINWEKNTRTYSNSSQLKIPYFQEDKLHYNPSTEQLLFVYTKPITKAISYSIENIVYEDITEVALGDLNKKTILEHINSKQFVNNSRGEQFITIEFSPIIKQNNSYKRVKSFEIIPKNTPLHSQKNQSIATIPTISNSVLAQGDWYKFYVEHSGVYKITKNFIQSLGMNLSGIDPRKIKIYGNGGRMLPLVNNQEYPFDLTENAIMLIGQEDNSFDDNDYILFYAQGIDTYNDESDTHINLYSDKSYYYITTEGSQNGKRISPITEPTGNASVTTSEFDDYIYHEKDLTNFAHVGRKWFGETFNVQNEYNFDFNIPNLVHNSAIELIVKTGLETKPAASFTVYANGANLGNINYSTLGAQSETLGRFASLSSHFTSGSDNVSVRIRFNNNGIPTARGYLDYIALKTKRYLRGYGKQFHFSLDDSANNLGIIEYQLSNAANINQIWEVTDIYNVRYKQNNGQHNFSLKSNMGELKKFIALDMNDLYTPLKENYSKVNNQNIKGTIFYDNQGNFVDIDYVIVTPNYMITQAEKLAHFHRTNSNLSVKVIPLELIYEEFSSGKQDIGAIRNLMRYIYHNASSADKRIKYLNLFGDASYDFKDRIPNNTNIVPIFQLYDHFATSVGLWTYCSDDYFACMDDTEGNINSSSYDKADFAVGRILASSPEQAEQMVQKIINYHDLKSYDSWRNNLTLIADDVDVYSDHTLQLKLNELADAIQTNKPAFNINKIYLDSYVQETASGGARYPQVRTDIINAFEAGSLIFNYLGHGGEEGLAHERIFEKSDAQNLNNQFKYPIFITVTCEFTKFDNPLHPTAGEYVYWNPKAGAVGMITTTRTVGIGVAQNFNLMLGQSLFSYGMFSNTPYPTLGEALRLAKNQITSGTRMIACVGDPALEIAIPKPKITITHINNVPIADFTEPIQALSQVNLKGIVSDNNDNMLSDYNGLISIEVFDKNTNRSTLGNDGVSLSGNLITMDFNILGETIFRGKATVNNGNFSIDFVVPRDIKIPVGHGRISLYSKKNNEKENQMGYSENILFGGINQNAPLDNTPPTVKLYMNDSSFISGGITNNSPTLLAILEDENGINTLGGIGHDIIAILDNDTMNPLILNDYYQSEVDTYKKGKVSYPLRNLSPGMHTLTFKAWDVYNNLITSEIQFMVVGSESIELRNVLNYPNPFTTYTEFWFSHNKPLEPLDVQIQVFTITGKVVWTKNQTILTEGFLSKDIIWNGQDNFGNKLAKGVYVYKLTVKSNLSNKKAEKIEKLVIL